jgi:hypothetical protein
MLNFLSKILAGILVLVTLSVVASIILGQTLLSSDYMKDQLKQADAYARLSTGISKQLSQNVGVENPQITAAIQQVITPEILQQRIDPALAQAEDYYKGNGPPPEIKVDDLIAQAQAAGIPIQDDSQLSKPIQLAPANQDKPPLTQKFSNVGVVSIILAAVLVVSLAIISWKTGRYTILPTVAITCGILLGLIALFLLFSQSALDHIIKFDFNSNAYAGIAHDLTKNISHDLGMRFGIVALIFVTAGIVTRIVTKRMSPRAV